MLNSQGFVRVAFRLAFWELMHAPDFASGLIDCVDRGGDADTNGAIAGSLLGSYFGQDAIPPEWRDQVRMALADNPGSRWWREYHPRFMLAMVP
jgi:ADP-ribosylglycohydrolase